MKRIGMRGRATGIILCTWLVATCMFACFTNAYWQLASIAAFCLLFVCGIATLASGTRQWRKDGILGMVPLAACVFAFACAPFIATGIRMWKFHINKPMYERVVEGMASGRIPLTDKAYFGRTALAAGDAYMVHGERSSKGLAVEFLTDSGFPVKHSGYLYLEQDILQRDSFPSARWPRWWRIEAHWYRISD